jgi:hypothetical protein
MVVRFVFGVRTFEVVRSAVGSLLLCSKIAGGVKPSIRNSVLAAQKSIDALPMHWRN